MKLIWLMFLALSIPFILDYFGEDEEETVQTENISPTIHDEPIVRDEVDVTVIEYDINEEDFEAQMKQDCIDLGLVC